jgi:hypothetical protein
MEIAGWIYLGMGALLARILLDGTVTRGYSPLDWFRLVFDAARITLLWPLVLFIERIEGWFKKE